MPVDQEGNDYPHSIAAHKDQPEVLDLQVAVKPRPRPVLCTVQKYILSCVCCLPGNTHNIWSSLQKLMEKSIFLLFFLPLESSVFVGSNITSALLKLAI